MSRETAMPEPGTLEAPPVETGGDRARAVAGIGRVAESVVRSVVPVLLALVAGGLVLLALGANPITFYRNIWSGGVELSAWQDTVMRMAPLLLIACGLIYVFKAGIWNLGIDGQFLLASAVIAGIGPELFGTIPDWLLFLLLFLVAAVVGAVWTIVPALLRAYYGVNEIITTLMMTFIGINLANILVKEQFQDVASNVPQTRAIPFTNLLPTIPGTRIHVGVLVAGVGAVVTWYLMSRTSFGLRLAVLGANARAAAHVGISVPRLIVALVRRQRGLRRPGGGVGDPRHLGLRARRLEPGLRAARGPPGLPGPVQRDRRDPVRRIPGPADHRRRLRDAGGRRLQRVHPAAGGPDPALHGRHRAARAPPGPRPELHARRRAAQDEEPRLSELFTQEVITALIAGGILAGIPLLFAALGEMVSERAGVLNIGIEGTMLVGAYVGFVAAYHGGSTSLGFLAGAGAGAAVSMIMVVLCVWLGLDQIVVGIAITLAAEGATAMIFDAQFAESRPTLGETGRVSIPLLSDIPVVGGRDSSDGSLFSQPAIVYIGLILVAVVAWMMRRTHLGLNIRAAGDKPAALDAAGVSVRATRSWAVLFGGAMAGVGGAYLSITAAGLFEDFITQGRGFIAIVLAMLARGKALWVLIGSFIFGISLSLSDALQIAGIDISTDVVFLLPFVAVMVVLILFGRRAYLPAALGLPYVRGAR